MSSIPNLFSVVIPTYNHAHYIRKCLDSLITQTYSNWEAIVVNNFSSDNTIEIVESYGDPRIRLINFANNGIIAASRNTGIKATKGEWICFLDSDDFWYSNKLEIVNEFILNNPDVDFICHELMLNNIVTGERKIIPCGPVFPDLYRELLISGNRFLNSASSVKKSYLQKFKIGISESRNFVSVEDFELCLQLAACNANFACINEPLGEYLLETNNISSSQSHLQNLELMLKFHVFEKQTFEPNKEKLWREVSCKLNIFRGSIAFHKGNYSKSFIYLLKAIKKSPVVFFKHFS